MDREEGEQQLKSKTAVCQDPVIFTVGISSAISGVMMMMEGQKMSFTIENILSKYPKSNCGRWTCDAGVKEKAGSPVGGHTETVHHALVCCCCYCSHCGDMLRYDFLHEGKNKTRSWRSFKFFLKKTNSSLCPESHVRPPPSCPSLWFASCDAVKSP